jgi:hypothetical protein
MSWSKLKKNLESHIAPSLVGQVEYSAAGYKFAADKSGICYVTVNRMNIFKMNEKMSPVNWYTSEQEILKDPKIEIWVTEEEIQKIEKQMGENVPKERLQVIAKKQKSATVAKQIFMAQTAMTKSNFTVVATHFLARPLEESLESEDIMLNVLALIDRRLGKKRLQNMRAAMKTKHPIVQYFYALRLNV